MLATGIFFTIGYVTYYLVQVKQEIALAKVSLRVNKMQQLESVQQKLQRLTFEVDSIKSRYKLERAIHDSFLKKTVAGIIHTYNSRLPQTIVEQESEAFISASREFHVPLALVLAVALQESRFDPGVKSHAGAVGVMQVLYSVHKNLLRVHLNINSVEELHNLKEGIRAGVYLLKDYLNNNSVYQALVRYSGGSSKYASTVLRRFANISVMLTSSGEVK